MISKKLSKDKFGSSLSALNFTLTQPGFQRGQEFFLLAFHKLFPSKKQREPFDIIPFFC